MDGRQPVNTATGTAVPFRAVLGEQRAEVLDVRIVDVHGLVYADLTLIFEGEVVESARIGRESIPSGLEVGERVIVSKVMGVVVSVRRV